MHSPTSLPTADLTVIVLSTNDISLGHFTLTEFPLGVIVAPTSLYTDQVTASVVSTFKVLVPPTRIVGLPEYVIVTVETLK